MTGVVKEITATKPSGTELEKELERTQTRIHTSQAIVAISIIGALILAIMGYFARDFISALIFGSIMVGGNGVHLLILYRRARRVRIQIAQTKRQSEAESSQL